MIFFISSPSQSLRCRRVASESWESWSTRAAAVAVVLSGFCEGVPGLLGLVGEVEVGSGFVAVLTGEPASSSSSLGPLLSLGGLDVPGTA